MRSPCASQCGCVLAFASSSTLDFIKDHVSRVSHVANTEELFDTMPLTSGMFPSAMCDALKAAMSWCVANAARASESYARSSRNIALRKGIIRGSA